MKRSCRWCQREFEADGRSGVCCSTKCAKAFSRHGCTLAEFAERNGAVALAPGRYRRTCQWCGRAFETGNVQQRNCSPACGKQLAKHNGVSKAEWKADVTRRKLEKFGCSRTEAGTYLKTCPTCARTFEADNVEQVFCSEACRLRAKRRRKRERLTGVPVKKTATCRSCGTSFETHDGRRRLCPACRERAKQKKASRTRRLTEPRTAVCAWCGTEFTTRSATAACCSHACYAKHRKHRCSRTEHEAAHPEIYAYLRGERSRTCAWCGAAFEARHPLQAYCSEACQKDAGHHRDCADRAAYIASHGLSEKTAPGRRFYIRNCQWCGDEFEATNILQLNCSESCGKRLAQAGGRSRVAWKAEVERRKRKTCVWCGREFRGRTTKAMFCSDTCNSLYYRYGRISREEARLRRLSTCEWCGKPFVADRTGVRFCCDRHATLFRKWQVGVEHRVLAVRRHYEVRRCVGCGHVFVLEDSRSGRLCPVCEAVGVSTRSRSPFTEFVEAEAAAVDMLVSDRRRHELRQAQYELLFGETRCGVCGAFVRRPRPGVGIQLCPSCYTAASDEVRAVFDRPVSERVLAYARVAVPKVTPEVWMRAWYARNREECAANKRAYRAEHAEELRQRQHDIYWSDVGRSREKNRFYYNRRKYGYSWLRQHDTLIRGNLYARVMRMRGIMSAAPDSVEVLRVYSEWRKSYLESRRMFRACASGRELTAVGTGASSASQAFSHGSFDSHRELLTEQLATVRETRAAKLEARDAALCMIRGDGVGELERSRAVEEERNALARRIREDRMRERERAKAVEEERKAIARRIREARRLEREAERAALAECARLVREERFAARAAKLEEIRQRRLEREVRAQWAAEHPEEVREARNKAHREWYWRNREDALRKHRIWRLKNRDRLLAEHRRKYWAARGVDIEARMAQEQEEMAARDAELFAARQKFAHVERVLRLPPEERWAFAKDWTEEERAYAASAAAKSYGHALSMFDHQDDVLSIGDLDG